MPKSPTKIPRKPGRRRRARIEALKREAASLAGGEMVCCESAGAPPEVIEKFWQHVVAWEKAEWVAPLDLLVRSGVELPTPAEVDGDVGVKLREVIDALASFRIYLDHTDHLSDRELYAFLVEEELREESVFDPGGPHDQIIDVVGSGSISDILLYLQYYADEEMRRVWAEDWPDFEVPAHRDPPHDRDRHLPQPGWKTRLARAPKS